MLQRPDGETAMAKRGNELPPTQPPTETGLVLTPPTETGLVLTPPTETGLVLTPPTQPLAPPEVLAGQLMPSAGPSADPFKVFLTSCAAPTSKATMRARLDAAARVLLPGSD